MSGVIALLVMAAALVFGFGFGLGKHWSYRNHLRLGVLSNEVEDLRWENSRLKDRMAIHQLHTELEGEV